MTPPNFFKLSRRERIEKLVEFILERNLSVADLQSRSHKCSIYSAMCTRFGLKNTKSNKLRLYHFAYVQGSGFMKKTSTPIPSDCATENLLYQADTEDINYSIVPYLISNNDTLYISSQNQNVCDQIIPLQSHSNADLNSSLTSIISQKHVDYESNLECNNSNTSIDVKQTTPETITIPHISSSSEYDGISTGLLPIGTNNICNSFKLGSSYKECTVAEGNFFVKPYYYNRWSKQEFNYVLKQQLKKEVNNTCPMKIKSKRQTNRFLKIYLKCIHPNCKLFLVTINKTGKAVVFSTSTNFNHNSKITSQVRGIERHIIKKSLKKTTAFNYKIKTIREASSPILKSGNLQRIKSDAVNRKMRSEALSALDRHSDDIFDMILMQRDNPQYIQLVASPLQIQIFSVEQLLLISSSSENPVLYFDATGSLPKVPKGTRKKCYYYCGVIQIKQLGRVCPIFEFILNNHDATTIGYSLINFKSFCTRNNVKWPPFKLIVTDFSFALINSVMIFWNGLTLLKYLSNSYENLANTLDKKIIPLKICCAHFMKIISNDVNKHAQGNPTLKNFLAAPFNINKYEDIKIWFKYVSIILLSEYETNLYQNAVESLFDICLERNAENINDAEKSSVEYNINHDERAQFKKSPYYLDFQQLSSEIVNDISNIHNSFDTRKNVYFSPNLHSCILTKYIPYLPLWSGLFLDRGVRHSNAPVESWNNILKNNIMEGQRHVKLSRICRKSREYVLSINKEVKYVHSNINRSHRNSKDEQLLCKEIWKDKRSKKKTFAYHKMLNLKPAKQKESGNLKLRTELNSVIIIDDKQPNNLDDKVNYSWSTVCEDDISVGRKPKLELFDNGLVKDSHYYTNIEDINYAVCYFDQFELMIQDYLSINIKPTAKLIQACFYVLQQKYDFKKFKSVLLPLGDIVSVEDCLNSCNRDLYDIIYKPFYILNSYKLLKIDLKNEILTLFNGSLELIRPIITLNDKFHGYRTKNIYSKYNSAIFNDSFFIIFSVEEEISEDLYSELEYTNKIQYDLLKFSNNVQKTCLYCVFKKHSILTTKWVSCDYCLRWIHLDCIPENKEFKNKLKESEFFCKLCEKYQSNLFGEIELIRSASKEKENSNFAIADYYTRYFEHCELKTLDYSDYSTLSSGTTGAMYLTNFIIDLCVGCFLAETVNTTQLTAINCNTASIIFKTCYKSLEEAETQNPKIFKIIPDLHGLVIMPFNTGTQHWVLAVADMRTKIFTFLDPQGSTLEKATMYLAYFINAVIHYCQFKKKDTKLSQNWRLNKSLKHPIQTDTFNCGIFILMFAEKLINNDSLMTCMDPASFRKYLKILLLQHGSNIRPPPLNHIIRKDINDPLNVV